MLSVLPPNQPFTLHSLLPTKTSHQHGRTAHPHSHLPIMVDACYNNSPSLPTSPYEYPARSERGSPFSPVLQPAEPRGTPPQDGAHYSPQRGARLCLFQPRDSPNTPDSHYREETGSPRRRQGTAHKRIVARGRYHPTDAYPRPHYAPVPPLRREDAFKVTTCYPPPDAGEQTDLLYRLGILYDDDATTP